MEFGSMEEIISNTIEDDSDRNRGIFRFLVRCGSCSAVWRSEPRPFTMAGVAAENPNKQIVYDALWEREWDFSRSLALKAAMEHFNLCPICKKTSCERCFRICADIDMCASCAQRLGEHGEPV